jgi:hypothetical protein
LESKKAEKVVDPVKAEFDHIIETALKTMRYRSKVMMRYQKAKMEDMIQI